MRMRVTIRDTKNPDRSVVLEFSASEERDIAANVKAAGDNFRMEYPDVPFDDKMISLDKA